MKYFNLVFINHGDKEKNYLFKLPLNIKLNAGAKVYTRTSKGDCLGKCESDSFIVDEYTANQIYIGVGAYYPLKEVIGLAQEQKGYRCIEFELMNVPF